MPKSLPGTFSRILSNAQEYGPTHQARLLRIIVAAMRPLTTEELREAMSVTYRDTHWDDSRLINNVYAVLASCGSLLFVDEEDNAVRFVHQSVGQFLLGDMGHGSGFQFTRDDADLEMAHIILTYLNFDVFNTQISVTTPSVSANDTPRKILASTLSSSSSAGSLALRLLRSKREVDFNIGRALAAYHHQSQNRDIFHFRRYAQDYYLDHSGNLEMASGDLLSLLRTTLEHEELLGKLWHSRFKPRATDRQDAQGLEIAIRRSYKAFSVVKNGEMILHGIRWRSFQDTWNLSGAIHWSLYKGNIGMYRSQLRHPRTGIMNICAIALSLRQGRLRPESWALTVESPRLLLRFLWLAATFKAFKTCRSLSTVLLRYSDRDEIYQETSLIDKNHPALPSISAASPPFSAPARPARGPIREIFE